MQAQIKGTEHRLVELYDYFDDVRGDCWEFLQGPDKPLAMAVILVGLTARGEVVITDGRPFARITYADHLIDVSITDEIEIRDARTGVFPQPFTAISADVLQDAAQAARLGEYPETARMILKVLNTRQ